MRFLHVIQLKSLFSHPLQDAHFFLNSATAHDNVCGLSLVTESRFPEKHYGDSSMEEVKDVFKIDLFHKNPIG